MPPAHPGRGPARLSRPCVASAAVRGWRQRDGVADVRGAGHPPSTAGTQPDQSRRRGAQKHPRGGRRDQAPDAGRSTATVWSTQASGGEAMPRLDGRSRAGGFVLRQHGDAAGDGLRGLHHLLRAATALRPRCRVGPVALPRQGPATVPPAATSGHQRPRVATSATFAALIESSPGPHCAFTRDVQARTSQLRGARIRLGARRQATSKERRQRDLEAAEEGRWNRWQRARGQGVLHDR